jgi:TonB family protein
VLQLPDRARPNWIGPITSIAVHAALAISLALVTVATIQKSPKTRKTPAPKIRTAIKAPARPRRAFVPTPVMRAAPKIVETVAIPQPAPLKIAPPAPAISLPVSNETPARPIVTGLLQNPAAAAPPSTLRVVHAGVLGGNGAALSGLGKVVRQSGFGQDDSPGTLRGGAAVRASGFDASSDPPAATRKREVMAASRTATPAEILSKPRPIYTDEARTRRVEGNVLLECVLEASGSVRVVRLLRGLGFGLDEAAMRAARDIRFRPATSNGAAVDFTANLRIVFQLGDL